MINARVRRIGFSRIFDIELLSRSRRCRVKVHHLGTRGRKSKRKGNIVFPGG